jgi:hypothetical protein
MYISCDGIPVPSGLVLLQGKLFILCWTTLSLDKTVYHRWSVIHWRNDTQRGERSTRNLVGRVTSDIVEWGDFVAGTVPWILRTWCPSAPLQAQRPLEAVSFWRLLFFKLWSYFRFLQVEVVKCSDVSERHIAPVFRAAQCNI